MRPATLTRAGFAFGALSIALGFFNWLWIFYAWDAAHHMGSPLRRHSKHFVESLTGMPGRVARDSHGTGLVLVDVLGNTFWAMFASGTFLILVGLFLIYAASRLQRMAGASPANHSLELDATRRVA